MSNASPTRYKNLPARIPAKDSTEAAVLLTVTHANTTCCQLCLVIFLFPKQLGHKIFNCCYYSSLDWSRFLILEKYLSHCLLSQHERRVSCGTYCIFRFFKFSLFGSCIGCSFSLPWHVLLTLDPHETLTLGERPPLNKRLGREERCLHECFFIGIQHPVKKDEVHLLKKSNPSD